MGKEVPGSVTPHAMLGSARKPESWITENGVREGCGGRPTKDALLLVILVCYFENNGKTSCFRKIVPA